MNNSDKKCSVLSANLNGDLLIEQTNKTVQNGFVASHTNTSLTVALRKGDLDFINKTATSITTYWFIDCKPLNTSYDFGINFNFTNTNYTHTIEALVVASYEPPITTTVAPTTTSTTTTTTTSTTSTTTPNPPTTSRTTTLKPTTTSTPTPPTTSGTTTLKPRTTSTNSRPTTPKSNVGHEVDQLLPYVCNPQDTILPPLPDQNKTYGFFRKEVKVRGRFLNWVNFLNVEKKGKLR